MQLKMFAFAGGGEGMKSDQEKIGVGVYSNDIEAL